jgi:hypothetical protein
MMKLDRAAGLAESLKAAAAALAARALAEPAGGRWAAE